MSALHAERWAMRALFAIARAGIEIPDDIAASGIAGIKAMGMKILAQVDFDDAEPLRQELLECVQIIPDPRNPSFMRSNIESDIEEISTFLKLRAEVFNLHTNFLTPDVSSPSTVTTAGRQQNTSNIKISPAPLRR